jgi:all-trans-retinol dehydrogenase (NAD+)
MFGNVTILINNAGIVHGKKIMDNSERDLKKTYEVNTISHALTVKEFLPDMTNKGHIVSVSSMAGIIGIPGLGDYCGSKFASFGFDESLRLELKKLGSPVKTTCVCPFFINTGMFEGVKTQFPLLPLLEPDWVADRIITAI